MVIEFHRIDILSTLTFDLDTNSKSKVESKCNKGSVCNFARVSNFGWRPKSLHIGSIDENDKLIMVNSEINIIG